MANSWLQMHSQGSMPSSAILTPQSLTAENASTQSTAHLSTQLNLKPKLSPQPMCFEKTPGFRKLVL